MTRASELPVGDVPDDIDRDTARFNRYMEYVDGLAGVGPGEYTQSFNSSFANLLCADVELEDAMKEFMAGDGRSQKPSNLAMKDVKAMQALQMSLHVPTDGQKIWTPEGLDTPESWEPNIRRIYQDDSYGGEFESYLLLPNAANIPRRSVVYAGVIALAGREGEQRILDVGCSMNLSLVSLATRGLNLGGLEVVEPFESNGTKTFEVSDSNTEALNTLIRTNHVEVGPSLGIDILDWRKDPKLANYVRSNSFYLEELFDTQLISQFDRLSRRKPKNVGFQIMDITVDYTDPEAREKAGVEDPGFDESFDVVYLSTMLYQLKKAERVIALANAHRWVKPDGLIVVQDFVDFKAKRVKPPSTIRHSGAGNIMCG